MCSVKKVFLEISQNSQENTCARVSFLIKLQALGLCEIHKNTFFTEHLWATASDIDNYHFFIIFRTLVRSKHLLGVFGY